MRLRQEGHVEAKMREKRRGSRMNSCVPVTIEWREQGGTVHREEAHTRVVNFYGCLLVAKHIPPVDQNCRLTNLATQQASGAVVVWKGKERVEGWELGVELIEPDMDFWGIDL